ncbi:hypothetical protein E3P77_03083 [Wallemia ichthyophaga]|uniref:Uncharacterized protein n=1 Tax=Wallemia ichthyophaga TaxID=245174 RepID=A0A4T0GPD5_WALIC|nr:hypothetical protein E3P95_00502 [Wallemia ichthyophaga]TIB08800.1 hypothetical protein E3P90_03525 [Wallemia ichthyophaga]TIB10214.1 hypothetical protein E3P93_02938 [Wallemia ichthyophaga]TIB20912.1 hypothetical protein E3P89_02913 [Wallemia ichthyophaga]TIB21349.1 hypothetical protein E3P88_03539 [Wallemia ichthyophaga]
MHSSTKWQRLRPLYTRRQQAQPGQWQSNWPSPQNNPSSQDVTEKSASSAVTTGESQPEPESSQESSQEQDRDTLSDKGKSALAPTLTIFIVIALVAVALLYWTRRRKRFVKDEQKKLEVETVSSTDKDYKGDMFDRIESPPPIYTRSSSLSVPTRKDFINGNRDNDENREFSDYSLTAPTVRFGGSQIPSRSSSVTSMPASNSRANSYAGTGSNRSSVANPNMVLPPKTYTPFEETMRN